jgi:RNA polymerase sigma-70 factor (ECF subfamily)
MQPEQIFLEALERYERPLYAHARTITGEAESARDAVQETFLRLSRQNLEILAPRLGPWLFLVCRRCALDACRRAKSHPVADPGRAEIETASADPSPAEQAVREEEAARVRELVGRLPTRQRELVQLRFEGGLSYKEMSEVLRISVSQVGVELHHALRALRRDWFQASDAVPL